MKKNKICFVVSTIMTIRAFLENHIRELSKDFDIYVVANITESDKSYIASLPLKGYKHIKINRNIKLVADFCSVSNLTKYFKQEKFFAVHSVTPKAGLVTAFAGKFAGIRHRIHIFTGQVWASRSGLYRYFLKVLDKCIVALNTKILIDGKSQQAFLIQEKIVKETNSKVLASGSIAGVNTERFSPSSNYRTQVRSEIGLTENQIVFLFLGRLCKDKGIDELLEAFSLLFQQYKNTFLLLIGPEEEDYATKIMQKYPNLISKKNFFLFGPTLQPERLLNAGDVFCLPSYREGFGVSVIEAASVGLATIVSNTYGLRDSIIPDITGLVCITRNVNSLFAKMKYFVEHPEHIKLFGNNGRIFIQAKFEQKDVTKAWVEFYKKLS